MPTLIGIFLFPVLTDAPVDDPWQRVYLKAPKCTFGKSVKAAFPLRDFRPQIFDDDTPLTEKHTGGVFIASEVLTRYGFTAVRHKSELLHREHGSKDWDSAQIMLEIYYPEVKALVKQVTGAREVFIMNSIVRRGQSTGPRTSQSNPAEEQENEQNLKDTKDVVGMSRYVVSDGNAVLKRDPDNLSTLKKPTDIIHIPGSQAVPPARVSHLDYTPLGARNDIRFSTLDVHRAAAESGVIEAEDRVCQSFKVKATSEASSAAIAEKYNGDGPGPRYAAYTVWRPLKTVKKDPLCMLPRADLASCQDVGLVGWPYMIRSPGHPSLGGDYLKQLMQLRATTDSLDKIEDLYWYYISDQEPDEVLIVNIFDSLALGENAKEAEAPFHGSPDIGVDGEGRESIEVRVFAFW